MTRLLSIIATTILSLMLTTAPGLAETLVWGARADRLEQQLNKQGRILAWETEVLAGKDDLKFAWQSEGEYLHREQKLEGLENRIFLQAPVSDFFDLIAGASIDTPAGPDRVYGVIGLRGLAPQWLELDASVYLSDRPRLRAEVEYEALITNRIMLQPTLEIDLPLRNDIAIGNGAFAPIAEIGLRLSYDLLDRAIVPYFGIQAERAFGKSANLRRAQGEDAGAVSVIIGSRFMF